MTILLCDAGGTHIRFAVSDDRGGMTQPDKLRVDAHASLEDAIERYLLAQSLPAGAIKAFYLAYSGRNTWARDEAQLRQLLPNAALKQVNDFEANALGIAVAPREDFTGLYDPKSAPVPGASRVVLGVGTGLGLAYIFSNGHVQQTHGGHMLPAMTRKEHGEIFSSLVRKEIKTPIYEDVLSGKGLFELYKLVCHRNQLNPEYHDVADLLISGRDDPIVGQALVFFHEILGIFAHQAMAFGYAYGGIYLTGGMIDRLIGAGLFDVALFLQHARYPSAPIVEEHVMATPVYWVRDEFISLRGLLKEAQKELS